MPVAQRPPDAIDLNPLLRACPRCWGRMAPLTLSSHTGRPVTVDHCGPCRQIWFDDLESVALDARVSQANGEPLSRGEVAARITSPSGVVETVRFAPPAGDTGWGVFASAYTPREPGKHEDNEFVLLRVSEFLRAL